MSFIGLFLNFLCRFFSFIGWLICGLYHSTFHIKQLPGSNHSLNPGISMICHQKFHLCNIVPQLSNNKLVKYNALGQVKYPSELPVSLNFNVLVHARSTLSNEISICRISNLLYQISVNFRYLWILFIFKRDCDICVVFLNWLAIKISDYMNQGIQGKYQRWSYPLQVR